MKVCPAHASVAFNAHPCPTEPFIFTKVTILRTKKAQNKTVITFSLSSAFYTAMLWTADLLSTNMQKQVP